MLAYIVRRILLMVPTLFGILLVSFAVVQFAPGGPIERIVARIQGMDVSATARFSGSAGGDVGALGAQAALQASSVTSKYRGAQGLDPEFIEELERQFGFDKPVHERFFKMVWDFMRFDFGESYFRNTRVIDLILEKMPVSISLGLWSTLLIYSISIPMGIRKAVDDGGTFDAWTSGVIVVAYAIPGFLFAVLLIVLFAGGSYFDWFPLRGLWSDQWSGASWGQRLSSFDFWADYAWHMTLPVVAMVVGGFATLTMLTKNSFLEEINKQYVMTARAKGLSETGVLYGHVFRNAMLIVIAGFPGAFISVLFTGSLLIEIIFSLDGLGLLGFEAALNRDYPVMFASLYFFTLLGLVMGLVGDLMYVVIDPRIDFASRRV